MLNYNLRVLAHLILYTKKIASIKQKTILTKKYQLIFWIDEGQSRSRDERMGKNRRPKQAAGTMLGTASIDRQASTSLKKTRTFNDHLTTTL